jgi:hypothetical protein
MQTTLPSYNLASVLYPIYKSTLSFYSEPPQPFCHCILAPNILF